VCTGRSGGARRDHWINEQHDDTVDAWCHDDSRNVRHDSGNVFYDSAGIERDTGSANHGAAAVIRGTGNDLQPDG
jgi:hypothetical protein